MLFLSIGQAQLPSFLSVLYGGSPSTTKAPVKTSRVGQRPPPPPPPPHGGSPLPHHYRPPAQPRIERQNLDDAFNIPTAIPNINNQIITASRYEVDFRSKVKLKLDF